MQRWPRLIACVVIAWVSANQIAASDAVTVTVSPTVASEPARITIVVSVEPDADNRALEVITESEHFFRSSYRQLEGERSARTSVFVYHGLPAGDYEVRVVLVAVDDDPRAAAVARIEIRP
jgi:methionine-rich copper-binding protein CopC